jgi:hypothetical protein
MTNKSLFRQMAGQVHPDKSTISEHASGAKMREVLKHRNEPGVLLALARKWGLQLDGSFNTNTFDRNSSEFAGRVFEAVVGAIVKHSFTYGRGGKSIYGVIVSIRKITKGYRKGANEFKLYDFADGTIWTLKTFDKQPFNKVVGMSVNGELREGKDKLNDIIRGNRAVKKLRQNRADDFFSSLGLKKDKNYMGSGLRVLIEYKNDIYKWHVLIRTTPKSVYVPNGNKDRRIPISSVRQIKMVA